MARRMRAARSALDTAVSVRCGMRPGHRSERPQPPSPSGVRVCVLGFDEARPFPAEERSLLTPLSGLIAQALERARLYDHENALARGLQNALLPQQLPTLPEARITGRYLPATAWMDIGGDWYDAIPTTHGIVLVVRDVEGHNPAAAATRGQLRSAVRAFAAAGQQPAEVMAGINRLLLDLDPDQLSSSPAASMP